MSQVNHMSMLQRVCLVLFLCFPVLLSAQQSAAPASSPQPPAPSPSLALALAPADESRQGRIVLSVVVTDKSGKPVSGLELKDFTLLDNNQQGKILSFHAFDGTVHSDDPPVKVILLLDTVNISFQQVADARQQIEKFLRQKSSHLSQPMSIYLFTNDGLKFQFEPSSDGNALAADLKQVDGQLRTIGQAQAGWGDLDRVLLSVRNLDSIAQNEANSPDRKILIWVGHGWPMLNSVQFQVSSSQGQQQLFDSIVELSNSLREAHIALYSISSEEGSESISKVGGGNPFLYQDFLKGVKSVQKASFSNLGLKVLAIQSGGRVLGPSSDLVGQIASCVQDASSFYTISFDPPRADKPQEYHDLKVIIDKPGLTAHTNTGYYN
jgi:VWFA-related protein